MNKKLEWNIYCPELSYSGRPKILIQNIFELNWVLNAGLYELRNIKEKNKFDRQLNSELQCELWSRSEYETYLSNAFNDDDYCVKIDPYQQVKMNWEAFVDYCWENKRLFCKFKHSNQRLKEVRKYWRNLHNEKEN